MQHHAHFFKKLLPEILPAITNIINASFSKGQFPSALKIAIITPIIKSLLLDPEILNHFRPISNLPLLSKIVEKCILRQLTHHLDSNNLYAQYQSAYRANFSCETALTKIMDDVTTDLGPNSYVLMALLDFSAAFDTVDQDVLLFRLKNTYGITGLALSLLESYLKNRYFKVKINNTVSEAESLSFGVPQGSILGPILYLLYVKEIDQDSHLCR